MNTQTDLWLLRGLLLCDLCQRPMVPDYDPGTGARIYSCGPTCQQPDLAATPVEQDMLLGALVRGATTMHDDLGSEKPGTEHAPWLTGPRPTG
ncbi:MAG: hypothetical protein ACRDUA_00750 [Micromonosporaceae bacterium]